MALSYLSVPPVYIITSVCSFLRRRNISDKTGWENQKTFYVKYIFSENRAFDRIMWKNIVQPDRSQTTTQYGACVLHAGCLRVTNTHKTIIFVAFARQQWSREFASM